MSDEQKTPKQKFEDYVRSLGISVGEKETYSELIKKIEQHFSTEENPPQMEPMLAYDVTSNPDPFWNDPDWIAEEKYDGIRMLMYFYRGRIRFTTRNRDPKTMLYHEKTNNYPQFLDRYREELEGTILDGEMIGGANDKREPLAAIQAINGALPETAVETQKKFGWARYVVFDIIKFCKKDVTEAPLIARKELVRAICQRLGLEMVKEVNWRGDKKAFYEEIVRRGGEGVMLKHQWSRYKVNSREECWLKVKRYDDVEAVITGWSKGCGRNRNKVGSCIISIDGKQVGAFGNMTDSIRNDMTAPDGSLKQEYYGRRVLVRYQPPLKGLMRHCRLLKLLEKENEES